MTQVFGAHVYTICLMLQCLDEQILTPAQQHPLQLGIMDGIEGIMFMKCLQLLNYLQILHGIPKDHHLKVYAMILIMQKIIDTV